MLLDRLSQDMKDAMKARAELRLSVLRLTLAQIKNARIEKGKDLTDEDVIQVLRRAVKQREESAEQYRQGDRADMADRETEEAKILTAYLPQPLSEEELREAVKAAIQETGATSMKEMGKVMKAVMAALGGRADGKSVQAMVRGLLAGS